MTTILAALSAPVSASLTGFDHVTLAYPGIRLQIATFLRSDLCPALDLVFTDQLVQ